VIQLARGDIDMHNPSGKFWLPYVVVIPGRSSKYGMFQRVEWAFREETSIGLKNIGCFEYNSG